MTLNSDFKELLSLFIEFKARFLVVGGYALAAHLEPRYTKDLDIWVDPTLANGSKVFAALAKFGAPLSGIGIETFTEPGYFYVMGVPPTRVDVLTRVTGLKFSAAWKRRYMVPIEDLLVPFIGRADLILNKKAVGRPIDRIDVEHLQISEEVLDREEKLATAKQSRKPAATKSTNKPSKSAKRYWLMKCEPDCYSIDDLKRDKQTTWEGVRNYQARNFIRDDMKVGDEVLFYHSSCEPPGVAGLAKICKAPYPDDTAWDPKNMYFDPKSTPAEPIWMRVDVAFVRKFKDLIGLDRLKANEKLIGMLVTARGSRLSIQPVSPEHFAEVVKMAATA